MSGDEESKATSKRSEVVRGLLKKLDEDVAAGTVKATLGDYIRLIQLLKELELEEPREIRVTWVDPGSEG